MTQILESHYLPPVVSYPPSPFSLSSRHAKYAYLSPFSAVGDGGDGGSANVGLITGLTVGLAAAALIVVLVVIAAGGAYTWYKRRMILGRLNNQPSAT